MRHDADVATARVASLLRPNGGDLELGGGGALVRVGALVAGQTGHDRLALH